MILATVPSVSVALRSADRSTPRAFRASAALLAFGSSVPKAVAILTANSPTVVLPVFAGAVGAAYAAATSTALKARTTNAFVFMIRSLPSASLSIHDHVEQFCLHADRIRQESSGKRPEFTLTGQPRQARS